MFSKKHPPTTHNTFFANDIIMFVIKNGIDVERK